MRWADSALEGWTEEDKARIVPTLDGVYNCDSVRNDCLKNFLLETIDVHPEILGAQTSFQVRHFQCDRGQNNKIEEAEVCSVEVQESIIQAGQGMKLP